jgi:hypothetical protein
VRVARTTHTEPYKILLGMLIEARSRADVTQAELAKRLGRPQPVIQFYAIWKALGLDPEKAFHDLIVRLPPTLEI